MLVETFYATKKLHVIARLAVWWMILDSRPRLIIDVAIRKTELPIG